MLCPQYDVLEKAELWSLKKIAGEGGCEVDVFNYTYYVQIDYTMCKS